MGTEIEMIHTHRNIERRPTNLRPMLWILLGLCVLMLCGVALIPAFAGWIRLGEVQLTDACGGGTCDLDVTLNRRFGIFSLSTDVSQSMPLIGSLQVVCGDGQQFTHLLTSPNGPGIFQSIGNPCINLDATKVVVHVEAVQVPQVDLIRGVHLTLYTSRF